MGDSGGDSDWYGYCLDDPVNGNDPLGLFAWVPLAGAAIGGASNAYDHWDEWDYGKGSMSTWDFAKSVGLGMATGAVSTLGGGIGSTLLWGAGAAAANEAGNQMIKKGTVDDVGKVAKAGGAGILGAATGVVGKRIGKNLATITPPHKIPMEPLKDGSKLGGIIGSTVGSKTAEAVWPEQNEKGKSYDPSRVGVSHWRNR
ncbi:hypothetical protein [Pseudodesulfovibrio sp.]|uniref:hypothetical protein n=1 Tax=Pseudodesulfovibrio sp. TaxID=2035812 RepID=UPI002636EED4|nr:hypothetical protein [Pseudodesulfovibrio sp.]MDD3313683.1 hypothetical protein [Pseudodesulfovibrio sp.]